MTNDTMAETWLKSYHENDTKIKYGGRDMVGYGSQTPQFKWPKGAKVALNFVINYEEGGESCVLHGDNKSERLLSEIVGAPAYGTFRFVFVRVQCGGVFFFGRRVVFVGTENPQKTDETSHRRISYNRYCSVFRCVCLLLSSNLISLSYIILSF